MVDLPEPTPRDGSEEHEPGPWQSATDEPTAEAEPWESATDELADPEDWDSEAVEPWGGTESEQWIPEPDPRTAEPTPWEAQPEDDTSERSSAAGDADPSPATEPSSNLWGLTGEPVFDALWSGEPASAEPWAERGETPSDPWLAPEPETIHEAPAVPASSGNPVEDAFYEWFGTPDEPLSAAEVPSQEAAPSPMETGASEPRAEEGEDEDEDLEMFRAWLQSLKR
jgi:hypothetical protein